MIDTDSDAIAADAAGGVPERARASQRPEHLLGGDVPMNDVLLNDIEQVPADLYVQTHSTNPLLRSARPSARRIDAFLAPRDRYDSLFTVTPLQTRLWTPDGKAINHDPDVLLARRTCRRSWRRTPACTSSTPTRCAGAATASASGRCCTRSIAEEALGHRRRDRLVRRRGAVRQPARRRMSAARVLITCPQMQNCIDEFRDALRGARHRARCCPTSSSSPPRTS